MTRDQVASTVTGVAAAAFLLAAALTASSYSSVAESAQPAPADVASLLPALWLIFVAALVAFGMLLAIVARTAASSGRTVVLLAATFAITSGVLFWRFLGFESPAAILLVIGTLTVIAAALRPQASVAIPKSA